MARSSRDASRCTAANRPWRRCRYAWRSSRLPAKGRRLSFNADCVAPDPRLLGLRSHARADRRLDRSRRHRSGLSQSAGGGDLLPHAALSRVRLLGDVALLVLRVAALGQSALHRDPGVPVALLPAFVHLRLGKERHPRARGPQGQAHRRAGIPDDRASLDPRHSFRRLRRQGDRRGAPLGRRGRAGARREIENSSTPGNPLEAYRSTADAVAHAGRWRARRARHRACALDVLQGVRRR